MNIQSKKIEYLRFDDLQTGINQKGNRYLYLMGDNPVANVVNDFDEKELRKSLGALFSKRKRLSTAEQQQVIKTISNKIKQLLKVSDSETNELLLQLDLVFNAAELGAIPFELLLNESAIPFFANKEKSVVLTRRIRHGFQFHKMKWPVIPRVLFAYANPSYKIFQQVPFRKHKNLLEFELALWLNDGQRQISVLDIVAEASIEDIRNAFLEAEAVGHPYTHFHLIAHGDVIQDEDILGGYEHGVALKGSKPTRLSEFKELFQQLSTKPFLVSYMICNGGSYSNAIEKDKSITQITHQAGVPIVIGSQFPLTFKGAEIITKGLYKGIFSGTDIRQVLHDIRCKLYDKKAQTIHDWFSLVSYVSLAEGYADYLKERNIERELFSLKALQKKIDALITDTSSTDLDLFLVYLSKLEKIGEKLDNNYKKLKNTSVKAGVKEENAGLLGSTYKRLAELRFNYAERLADIPKKAKQQQQELEDLKNALKYYKEAADCNLSHHWSTVQFLALDLALNGTIKTDNYWAAAVQAATNDTQKEGNIWGFGSLVELYLIAPNLSKAIKIQQAKEALTTLLDRAIKDKKTFAINSTKKQLNRYVHWWTPNNNYFDNPEIVSTASALLELFPK